MIGAIYIPASADPELVRKFIEKGSPAYTRGYQSFIQDEEALRVALGLDPDEEIPNAPRGPNESVVYVSGESVNKYGDTFTKITMIHELVEKMFSEDKTVDEGNPHVV